MTLKNLGGGSNPVATTATDLYTVPSGKEAAVSTITVCETAGAPASYRIAIRVGGASLATKHYRFKDVAIGASVTHCITVGYTLAATDVITVYASTASLSFNADGNERTAT